MALILSLETSTSVCSVALHKEGKLLALLEVHMEQAHASKLAVLIDEVKTIAGVDFSQIAAVAISSGPGSYTGLRIGTSTAKGLCYALNIPLLAVNSLLAMAHSVSIFNASEALLCPMIDARRMEVYCLLADNELNILRPTEAKVIDENSFAEYLINNNILFFGDGAAKCNAVIRNNNAKFLKNIYPSASHIGVLAFNKYKQQEAEDIIHFEPFYLKDFLVKKPFKV